MLLKPTRSIPVFLLFCISICSGTDPETWRAQIETETDAKRQVDLYVDLGRSMLDTPVKAIESVEQGIALAKEIEYLSGEADLLNLLGVISWQKGNLLGAIDYYEQSLELRNTEQEGESISDAHGNIGIAYLMLGKFDESIDQLEKCVSLRRTLGLNLKLASAAGNLGYAYFYKGEYEEAIRCYLEAVEIFETQGDDSSLSSLLNNIGGVYFELEEFEKAQSYFERALVAAKRLDNETELIPILGNLGHIDLYNEQYSKAIEKYLFVLEKGRGLIDPSLAVEASNGLGNAYQELGHLDQAIKYYRQAIDVEADPSLRHLRLSTLLSLASLYFEQYQADPEVGDLETLHYAVSLAEEALAISTEMDLKRKQSDANYRLFQLYELLGDPVRALDYFKAYKEISDAILDAEKHQQIAELETQYQVANKNREIETLEAKRQIQELKINEQQESMKAQQRLNMIALIILLTILLTGYLLWKWMQSRQRNARNELLIKNLRTEQRLFRSQMNPHFIYNSLNSIQSYISSNESYLAEKYLAKFAKLMRGILENSMKETVPFEKELEVIDGYLELEKVRFEGRFDFEIRLDDDLEEEFVSIPPMLIQPFLENSILHGFANVKGDGLLKVSFREEDDYLICEIDDNGIGRVAAGNLPKKKGKTSLATQITNDRLATISQQAGRPASIEFLDKYEDKEQRVPAGTRVILNIPILD